ncbi:glycosyltransferase family 4 protein [Nakamurella flava]|uniref:Glycosyltransferase family 4 protein n=1 Tax=Nakamurella flava TaxID=2576308 RepID=A0A4U6QFT7_9ACTN|nr:glycosyltransferase [Nakamurella flava]TKV58902.1 glycosyltransferase family 4 protein [Nakamurella flava]
MKSRSTPRGTPTATRPVTPGPADAALALAARLRAAAGALQVNVPPPAGNPGQDAADVLVQLCRDLHADPADDRIWLVMTCIATAYPSRDEIDDARRMIELNAPDDVALILLENGLHRARLSGLPLAPFELLVGQVLVDVDFSARHDLHTGIQRVVRNLLPHWNLERSIVPVVWARNQGMLRRLDPTESTRIYDWVAHEKVVAERRRSGLRELDALPPAESTTVVPWRCVLVLPEVPPREAVERIAAIGACSNTSVVAVGYDMIPLVSADTVGIEEPTKFMPYLAAVKFADRVAGISRAAADEFAAFAAMLPTQGLTGPEVVAVSLPVELNAEHPPAPPAGSPAAHTDRPQIVIVGSHDTRKNHLAVLHAAELLWQEGLDFGLTFIGGGGSNKEFFRRAKTLAGRGRAVEVRTSVPEDELRRAVAEARFTMFPSIHEGYGLPVAESMALGTPVITTNYGSTAEIAADGGALTVDPRDDASITDAMRTLLTDDGAVAELRAAIAARTERTWQDYADELWAGLVEPALTAATRNGTGHHAAS